VLDPIKELHSDKQVTYFVKTLYYYLFFSSCFLFFYSPAPFSLLVDPLNLQLHTDRQHFAF
jgi:hypothetical protein